MIATAPTSLATLAQLLVEAIKDCRLTIARRQDLGRGWRKLETSRGSLICVINPTQVHTKLLVFDYD